jgi:hypothetical protein
MKAHFCLPLLLAACDSHFDIGDPGFLLRGVVAAQERLDYAPVLVQAFAVADLDDTGAIAPGARPFVAGSFSGPLAPGEALPFTLGGRCGRSGRLFAWIDVDGNARASGTGGWEYDARPSPGDLVARPQPVWADTVPGTCGTYTVEGVELNAGQAVFGVGDGQTRIQVDVSAGAAPFNAPFSAFAYRPEDFIKGRPCTSCAPLFTLSVHEMVWNASQPMPHGFEVDAPAVPMRIWLEGTLDGARFGARIEPTLFLGETGTRGRAAVGLAATLERL